MKPFVLALYKYLLYYPNARLQFIYRIESVKKAGEFAITFTQHRGIARRFKKQSDVKVQRKLVCRIL